jgi:UDP-glucose 4-epimerase
VARVLVTGGAGFIGSALCNRMAADGHDVLALDNGSRHGLHKPNCPLFERDIRDKLLVGSDSSWLTPNPFARDSVWHLAAVNGTASFYSRPADVLDVQIRGTQNVIDACVRHGVKELILFSSSEVYQTPPVIPTPEDVPLSIPDITNPRYSYAVAKLASEAMAFHSPIERVLIVRPHNAFGPAMGFDHVIPQFIMRAARTPDNGTFEIRGQSTRSFIYIDDFTDAMMAIWKNVSAREGKVREIFHVGTEEQVSMSALAGYVSDIMGKKGPQYPRGWAYRFKTVPGPVGGTRSRCPSVAKLMELGWSPKVTLLEGLRRTVEAYVTKKDEWPE